MKNWKKVFALIASLHLIVYSVFADELTATSYQPSTPITPDAGPGSRNGIGAFFTADFIFWAVKQEGLAFALPLNNVLSSPPLPEGGSLRSDIKTPKFRGEPGFKVGFGLNLDHDGWDIYGQYTWLHSDKIQNSTNVSPNGAFLNAWRIPFIPPDEFEFANTRFDLHFNVFDFELGRNFFISRYLKLRPFTGFKVAWHDQDYVVRYGFANDISARMRMEQDQWGFGIRTGINSSWQFTSHWSVYGDLALSGLWSGFKVERLDTATSAGIETTFVNAKNDFHTIKLVVEWGLGLRAQWWFCNAKYHFLIQAGWEEQFWLENNQYINLVFDTGEVYRGQDTFFQGLDLKFRFDF